MSLVSLPTCQTRPCTCRRVTVNNHRMPGDLHILARCARCAQIQFPVQHLHAGVVCADHMRTEEPFSPRPYTSHVILVPSIRPLSLVRDLHTTANIFFRCGATAGDPPTWPQSPAPANSPLATLRPQGFVTSHGRPQGTSGTRPLSLSARPGCTRSVRWFLPRSTGDPCRSRHSVFPPRSDRARYVRASDAPPADGVPTAFLPGPCLIRRSGRLVEIVSAVIGGGFFTRCSATLVSNSPVVV